MSIFRWFPRKPVSGERKKTLAAHDQIAKEEALDGQAPTSVPLLSVSVLHINIPN
jgi:hypothetical protein